MPDLLAKAQVAISLFDARTIDEAQLPVWISWLSPQELARYRRFMRPQRQRQFLLGRALLRTVLERELGVPAASIALEERTGQAPRLIAPADGPHFSLSHSGHWIACAVGGAALGLDIEVMDRQRDLPALARQAFGDAVADGLAAMAHADQAASFYRRWSQYEARYKLGAAAGAAASCVALAHPELSIVLCSAAPLAQRPVLRPVTLAQG